MGGPTTATAKSNAQQQNTANQKAAQAQADQAAGRGAFAPQPPPNPNANRNVDNTSGPILQGGTGKGTIILSGNKSSYGESQTHPTGPPPANPLTASSKSSSADAVYTPVDIALGQAPRSWNDRESEYAHSLIVNKGLKEGSAEYNQALSDYMKANNLQKGPNSYFVSLSEGGDKGKGKSIQISESLPFSEGLGGGVRSGESSVITVTGGLTDTKGQKDQESIFASKGGSKNAKPLEQVITNQTNKSELGNALISVSNQQIADKNIKSQKETSDLFAKGEKQDAVFTFFSGNKEIGKTSGARSFHDFLSAQKKNQDVSIQTNYPNKEKALSESVRENTDFFATLPKSYWESAGKTGYFSEKNQQNINDSFSFNYTHQLAQNLGTLQGVQPAYERGGIIPTKNGPLVIGPRENEASSFLKFPFAGEKRSTTLVPSTSLANVAQFAPGLPILDRLAGPAGEVWINLIERGGVKFGEIKTQVSNKVKTNVQEKALDNAYNFPKQKEIASPSFEYPTPGGKTRTVRPSNMFKKPLPEDLLSKDNTVAEKLSPVSARQNIPRNTMFEDTTKETQARNTKIQNDLLTPVTPKENPPASRNIPFFAGRKDQSGRLFTANKPPVNTGSASRFQNEGANVQGKISSFSPISTKTNPSETGLSPVSREFFGVQFKGTYPQSYLPPSSGFIPTSGSKPIVNLGERGDYQDFRFKIFNKKVASNPKFGFSILETKSSDLFPEFTNPLGRKGKPAIQKSYPSENIMSRAEFISSRKFSSEEFLTSSGKKGAASAKSFGVLRPIEKTSNIQILPEEKNPLGRRGKPPIKSTSNELILSRAEVVEKTRPSYSNEVFSSKGQRLSKLFGETNAIGVLSRETKTNAKTKTIELEPQKDYQDWRFSQWSKKNPTQEPTGNARIETFFKNLPSRNTKSAVVTNNIFNDKGVKAGFRRTGKTIYDSKPVVKEESKKETGFVNTGSKGQQSVLVNKPPTNRGKIRTIIEPKYDYEYEFRPVPPEKTGTSIISGLKISSFSGLKIRPMLGTKERTSQRPRLGTKLFGGQITSPRFKQSPKQSPRLFQTTKQTPGLLQTPKQTPKLTPKLLQTPKQTPTHKQTPKLTPKLTPHQPQTPSILTPLLKQPPRQPPRTPPPPPPRKLLPSPPLFGAFQRGGKNKTKNGPTALLNLNVNNIFSSSLSINVSKGKRYEF